MDGLLHPLTGLTGLSLSYECDRLPDALAQLSQLHWLQVDSQGGTADALPAGDWLRSLRWLALEYDVAEASVPQLTQATRLSRLSLLNLPTMGDLQVYVRRWAAFWQFAATHPPLRTLDIRIDEFTEFTGNVVCDPLEACMRLTAKRPSLRVAVRTAVSDWPLDELKAMAPAEEG